MLFMNLQELRLRLDWGYLANYEHNEDIFSIQVESSQVQ